MYARSLSLGKYRIHCGFVFLFCCPPTPTPVVQRLQTPQPPTGVKQNQAAKPGTPVKAPSSALKRKATKSESSSSSDSEDETVPAAQNLPPPSGKMPSVLTGVQGTFVFSFRLCFFS